MTHLILQKKGRKTELYLLYWTCYLLLFTMIEGLAGHDFVTVFRNELICGIPKALFVYIIAEILINDLFDRQFKHFIVVYILLLLGFAFCLRLIDNYIIIKYYLIYWVKEPLLSPAPFLYNMIKLQFLLTIPFCLKLYWHFNKEKVETSPGTPENEKAFLHLTCERRMIKILFNDIYYFEAQGNYLLTYTNKGVFKAYLAISKLEEVLPGAAFARIHRSFIVALDKVDSHTSSLVIIGDKKIPIGRSYAEKARISFSSILG